MTKSRMALAAAIAALSGPAAAGAQALTAEEAIDNSRRVFTPVPELMCPKEDPEGEEIVVCGRLGPGRHRVFFPPETGRRIPGEPMSTTGAMRSADDPCTTVGPNQRCGGGLPVIPIILGVAKGVAKVLQGDD